MRLIIQARTISSDLWVRDWRELLVDPCRNVGFKPANGSSTNRAWRWKLTRRDQAVDRATG